MSVIHLTPEEKILFARLPETVRGSWLVADEYRSFSDSPELQAARFRGIQLRSRKLRALQEQAPRIGTLEELQHIIDGVDLTRVPSSDLKELLFALGPNAITAMITTMLADAKSPSDIRDIAFLTQTRDCLYQAHLSNATPQ